MSELETPSSSQSSKFVLSGGGVPVVSVEITETRLSEKGGDGYVRIAPRFTC
jgi:hypothetical protein